MLKFNLVRHLWGVDPTHSIAIMHPRISLLLIASTTLVTAAEYHVSPAGNDTNPGTPAAMLKTIFEAANRAQAGDTVTVHAGTYREWVKPPRGGTSDVNRIIYQAAPGEKVVITGSEPVKGWEKIGNDTWKLVLPASYFGKFNPYAEKVHGDWFDGRGRIRRRGNVYLNGEWLAEAPNADAVMQPAGAKPMWFSAVDGLADDAPLYLLNIVSFKPNAGASVAATKAAVRNGTQDAPCSEGGQCVGFINHGSWVRYDPVDFGTGSESVEFRAAAAPGTGGVIELRDGHFDGELLGTCPVGVTGDWQKWQSFTAKIKKTSGAKSLYLVFKSHAAVKKETQGKDAGTTTIHAQFPGINPNESAVEISVRPTVFTPEKTNINYLTVRGFELRNAATNWAAPTAGQVGLVTAYWNKGWIIENNEISYSRCAGVALGKYSDQWDGKRGTTEGYYLTIDDAFKKDGWSKDNIGSHIVRNNHIHHCGQVGIVGSLGCAFSRVEGNEIHECNMQGIWGGAEMAGIKFHGAIDTVITGNHIYRCGHAGGIWLDWMAQGTQVTCNLLHDNQGHDLFTEVNHGPFLVANNIMLSAGGHLSNSQGGAYAHNLMIQQIHVPFDGRRTPFHKAHSTETVGMHNCPVGDARWYNNLFAGQCNLGAYNGSTLPVTAVGNVFTKGATASKFDTDVLLKPDFDPGIKLLEKPDGWYLEVTQDPAWATEQARQLVTTELLGKAVIPDAVFENPDGTPLQIDTDYFGTKRAPRTPFPGPFETKESGKRQIKVWPKP